MCECKVYLPLNHIYGQTTCESVILSDFTDRHTTIRTHSQLYYNHVEVYRIPIHINIYIYVLFICILSVFFTILILFIHKACIKLKNKNHFFLFFLKKNVGCSCKVIFFPVFFNYLSFRWTKVFIKTLSLSSEKMKKIKLECFP